MTTTYQAFSFKTISDPTCWSGTPSSFERELLIPFEEYALEQLRARLFFAVTTNHDKTLSARAIFQMALETELNVSVRRSILVPSEITDTKVCERRRYLDIDRDMQSFKFLIEPALQVLQEKNYLPEPYVRLLRTHLASPYARYRVCAMAAAIVLAANTRRVVSLASVVPGRSIERSFADTVSVVEVGHLHTVNFRFNETLNAVDVPRLHNVQMVFADATPVSDTTVVADMAVFDGELEPQQHALTFADTATVADVAARRSTFARSFADSQGVTDAHARTSAQNRTFSDQATVDDASNNVVASLQRAFPADAAEWDLYFPSIPTPAHIWTWQEASGNIIDQIGTEDLVPNFSAAYQQPGDPEPTGSPRYTVKTVTSNVSERFDAPTLSLGDPATTFSCYIRFVSPDNATTERALMGKGGSNTNNSWRLYRESTTGKIVWRIQGNAGEVSYVTTANAYDDGTYHDCIFVINQTADTISLHIDSETLSTSLSGAGAVVNTAAAFRFFVASGVTGLAGTGISYAAYWPSARSAADLTTIRTAVSVEGGVGGGVVEGPEPLQQKVAVVGYFYPGAYWDQMHLRAPTADIVIMNPQNGPGYQTTYQPGGGTFNDYTAQLAETQATGMKAIHYLSQNYRDAEGAHSGDPYAGTVGVHCRFSAVDAGNLFTSRTLDGVSTLSHGWTTGMGPVQVKAWNGGVLPSGISAGTNYWFIYVSSTTFKLATSYANAMAGTSLSISTDSSGGCYIGLSRTLANIQNVYNEIDMVLERYPTIDGFFFDEMKNDGTADDITYVANIYNYIKTINPALLVFQNPGANFPESFEPYADTFMSFEGPYSNHPSQSPNSWMLSHPNPFKFWHAAHTASDGQQFAFVAATRARNVGYVSMNGGSFSNLPSPLWENFVDEVEDENADALL